MCPNFTFTIHGLASFLLPAYSVFACIGLLFMMMFLYAKTQQIGVSFLRFLLLVGAMAAGVGIGSKALFALTQIPEFLKEPTLRNLGEIIWTSGFVFYGGLFGAILVVKVYAKVFRLNRQSFLNQIAPAFPLSISGEESAASLRATVTENLLAGASPCSRHRTCRAFRFS